MKQNTERRRITMQFTMKFLALIFGMMLLATAAFAESPHEQLKQMVEQLQKNPADNALREKIIKLAQEIKPAPAVPEEAERRMARGAAAFKGAKSVADYRDAAKEFEQATLAAPWYGDAYFNLGVAQDKAENYEAALRSLKLARLASPEVKEIKALIYEVEYRSEKANSAVAALEQEKKAKKEFMEKLDGARFVIRGHNDYRGGESVDWMKIFEIRGNKAFYGFVPIAWKLPKGVELHENTIGVVRWDKDSYLIKGREFIVTKDAQECDFYLRRCIDEIQTITEDGNKIIGRRTYNGKLEETIYLREK
jgi:tetratricopeptide (TPR) repeat protein